MTSQPEGEPWVILILRAVSSRSPVRKLPHATQTGRGPMVAKAYTRPARTPAEAALAGPVLRALLSDTRRRRPSPIARRLSEDWRSAPVPRGGGADRPGDVGGQGPRGPDAIAGGRSRSRGRSGERRRDRQVLQPASQAPDTTRLLIPGQAREKRARALFPSWRTGTRACPGEGLTGGPACREETWT